MSAFSRLTLVVVILASLNASIWSQSSSAFLSGVVVHFKGAVLPDADLMLFDSQIGVSRSTKTTGTGTCRRQPIPFRYRQRAFGRSLKTMSDCWSIRPAP
jgi:hypothetical protein